MLHTFVFFFELYVAVICSLIDKDSFIFIFDFKHYEKQNLLHISSCYTWI